MAQREIIDAHAHIFSTLSGFGGSGEMKPLEGGKAILATGEVMQLNPSEYGKTEFPAEKLISLMDEFSIGKAVLLQGGFLGFNNYGVMEASERYPGRFSPALTVDPFSRNLDKILSYLLSRDAKAFKFEVSTGFGLMGIHPTFPLDGEMMYGIYRRLYGKIRTLAFDLGAPDEESHQTEAMVKIAKDFPSFDIVVCHLTSPRRGQIENLKRELGLLALPNVYFDTAALFWKTRPEEYPFPTGRSYLAAARDIVGAEHLMWGSDAPSSLVPCTMDKQISYAEGIFSPSEEEWYYAKTAEKVYF